MKKSLILGLILISNIIIGQTLIGFNESQVKREMNNLTDYPKLTIEGQGEFTTKNGKSLIFDINDNGINKYHIITLNTINVCVQHIILLDKQVYESLYSECQIDFKEVDPKSFRKFKKPDENYYGSIRELTKN